MSSACLCTSLHCNLCKLELELSYLPAFVCSPENLAVGTGISCSPTPVAVLCCAAPTNSVAWET